MTWLAALLLASSWLDPIAGATVIHGFDPPAHIGIAGHRGVDFAADPGTEVVAIASGVVAFAGQVAGRGVITIRHPGMGLRSTYEPVQALVAQGQFVSAGAAIGTTAAFGGHCGGRCLHLGLRGSGRNDYRNPLSLIDREFAVLKPLTLPRESESQ
ncbi:MAG: M23 family metallopeptidase [Candidatus Nanopelagicales bacterium]